jgi:Uma2 family endonuclease
VELWNGELVRSSAPDPEHQDIALNFASALKQFAIPTRLGKVYTGPIDVVLSPRRVVQPDVLFVSKARLGIIKHWIDGTPDLVVEVVSEQSWRRDRIEKKALYEQAGVSEYWVVDPECQTIEVFGPYQLCSRTIGEHKAKSKLLPDFGISLKDLLL